jgi:hypothetical protein
MGPVWNGNFLALMRRTPVGHNSTGNFAGMLDPGTLNSANGMTSQPRRSTLRGASRKAPVWSMQGLSVLLRAASQARLLAFKVAPA